MMRAKWPAMTLERYRGEMLATRVDRAAEYAPSADVQFTESEDQGIVLDLRGERYYGLGAVGARIWRMLDGGASLVEVVDRLSEEYDAPREQLDADAEAFLSDMIRRGFVVQR